MPDNNSTREKIATENGSSALDHDRIDISTLSSVNQDPRNISTRSLEYESVMLNNLYCKFQCYNYNKYV